MLPLLWSLVAHAIIFVVLFNRQPLITLQQALNRAGLLLTGAPPTASDLIPPIATTTGVYKFVTAGKKYYHAIKEILEAPPKVELLPANSSFSNS